MQYGIYYAYWAKEWGGDYARYAKKVSGLGFDILEISCAALAETAPAQLAELRAACEAFGVRLTAGYGPAPGENIASPDHAVAKNALAFWERTFPVLQRLGVAVVGGGLYSYWPVDYARPFDRRADYERSVAGMKKLAGLAAQFGLTLCMEALNRFEGYLINTAAEAVQYARDVGMDNVKAMLDTFHMNIEEDSIEDAILAAGPALGHFHVGECNRRPPRGGSRLDWSGIGRALRGAKYDGAVVMEPFVLAGGGVGRDIRVWRDIAEDGSEAALDDAAGGSLAFLRRAFGE
jgi:D-psicose/D-tagatose/L-ribulose 3-epimerase